MMTLARCLAAGLFLFIALTGPCAAQGEVAGREGFYRYPALRGQSVVFTAEGDLWRVDTAGGRAERLTTHPDLETRAALSPDGRSVAFSGAYERAGEAYVMPLAGGVPRRLTWDGQNPRVWGWTPDGEVLLTAPSVRGEPVTQLFAIDPRTQARHVLPVGQASDGALSPDGRTLFFTRHGLRGDNASAYRGGAMARLWRIDLQGSAEARPLLPADANSQRALPYLTPQGLRVAFLYDRDGRVNLWSVDAEGGDLRQHTHHVDWDVRHASIDGTRVVYALGADLHLIDLDSGVDRRLPIVLGGDADSLRTRWVSRPQAVFGSAALAPDGARVALTVRGSIATQGAGPLRRATLPVPPDARCRGAVFSHDSRQVYALCDIRAGGAGSEPPELEVWRFAADGSGSPLQITRGSTLQRIALFPSPDGRWLAHTDLAGRITLTALTPEGAGASRVIDTPARVEDALRIAWSPDAQALAYTRPDGAAERQRLFLYLVGPARTLALTSDRYDSASPAFTPDGRWLYFLSDRSFEPLEPAPWGDRNLGPYFDRRTKVYALALQPGLRFPFQPRDELQGADGDAPAPGAAPASPPAAGPAAAARPASEASPVASAASAQRPRIEAAGLPGRLYEVPLPAGNYRRLLSDGKRLYLLEADSTPAHLTSLRTLAIENTAPTPELFAADVNEVELTPDGKRLMLVRRAPSGPQPGDIQILDAAAKAPGDAPALARAQVRWTDWQLATDPAAEWREMFDDAWRMHRDHFYDARMHGADWSAARRKYTALLPRVGDRSELAELMAQLVAEVGALHSQVLADDLRRGPDNIGPAGLGARLVRDEQGLRIERIYRSDPELPSELAPLASVQAQSGDVITHLNGRPLAGVADLSELLRGQAERQVLLTLKGAAGERQVVVLPVNAARERQLRTGDWEYGRLERARERSAGRVGYLRLRAMGGADIATFAREFYAQIDREAIVIDVRSNDGGNVDSWIIAALLRRAWAYWQPRHPAAAEPYSNMQQTFRGHLAVLIDEGTYSDGETFAEGIRRLGLGTLVGRRTSGAGVWLSDSTQLLDGGRMRTAETGQFALDGTWLIEGRGVVPDIDVDNPPRATAEGGDAQLDAAVDLLVRKLAEQPIPKPVPPPAPLPRAARP